MTIRSVEDEKAKAASVNRAEKIKRKKIKAARDQQRRTCRKRRRKEKEKTVGKTNFRG